jgi:ribonuclease HI
MKFHQHVARMTAKAMKQCLAIKRLRGVRPKQVRQLYNATVTPIMDYCASAWYGPGKWGTTSLLRDMEKVQRIGAQAIILSFRATALARAQAEAGIETAVDRLQRKVANHLVRSLTVPNTNPLFDCLTRLFTQGKSFPSPLAITARKFGPDLGLTAESLMETVEPVLQEPWTEGIPRCLIKGLRDEAKVVIRQLRSKAGRGERCTFYTDAAQRNGESGIAVVQGNTGKIITRKRLPRWAAGDSTVAELIAIEAALAHQAKKRRRPTNTIIATDSKQAIRHIIEGTSPHGQYVVRYIRKHIDALQAQEGVTVTLQWVPAHKGWYGNEWADKQAKKALDVEQGEVEGAATQLSSSTKPLTPSDLRISTDLLTPTDPLTPLNARDRGMVKSRIYQQRYTGVTKKMALGVAKKTLQKKLDEIWKQARNTRP